MNLTQKKAIPRFGVVAINLLIFISIILSPVTKAEQEISTEVTEIIKPVKLFAVKDHLESAFDSFLAEIDATQRAQLSFQVAGSISALNVRMGDKVKQGQVLATLDPSDLQLKLDIALAKYRLADTQLKRTKNLIAKRLISQQSYDEALVEFTSARAELERAKTDMGYTKLVAPFDGLVATTFVNSHQVVNSKEAILNLINNETLDASFVLPVPFVEALTISQLEKQKMWITLDNLPEVSIPATFKEISTKPNADTNSYNSVVTISNNSTSQRLLSGITGQVHIAKDRNQMQVQLPDSAWVSRSQNQGVIWLMDEKTHKVSKVTVELDDNGNIINGLTKDDLIVVAGIESLKEGQVVKAWEREEGI